MLGPGDRDGRTRAFLGFLGLGRGDHVQRESLELFLGRLGAGCLAVLRGLGQNLGQLGFVLAGVDGQDDCGGNIGIVLRDDGDGERPLRDFEQLLVAEADDRLQIGGSFLHPGLHVILERLEGGIGQKLSVLALKKRLAEGREVVGLEKEGGRVGENLFRRRRGLSFRRESQQEQRACEGDAECRHPQGNTHHEKTPLHHKQ